MSNLLELDSKGLFWKNNQDTPILCNIRKIQLAVEVL